MGFDNLFPVALSLALESRGIKTIATQDRFVTPFSNNCCYILDTQLTTSNITTSALQNKPDMYYVREYLPMGLIRSDKLNKPKTNNNKS